MRPETRYARSSDGTHVAYQLTGDGATDILVMRAWHSNLDHEWDEPVLAGIYRRLGSLGRVLRLDRRGSGLSDRFEPSVLPTLEERIDDVRAVMDAAHSEGVVAIGLAAGGALCAALAAMHPERVLGLILWSPMATMVGHGPEAPPGFEDEMRRRWGTLREAEDLVRDEPGRAGDHAFVEWLAEDQRQSGSPDEAVALWKLVLETNVDDLLPAIHVPTLVAWRAGAPGAAAYVASRVPTATTLELAGDDHMLISGDWHGALRGMERFIETTVGASPETDRIVVTIMFTDIVGSTELAVRIGDRAWRATLERHHASVRQALARHRGREIDTAGDGFFAAFDGPARAIRCAVAIREALDDQGLTVRIGLHAGECERVRGGLRGLAVHVGARIAASASPGEILASATVRDLVAGSGIAFEDAGVRTLKG
ncbi:MAG: adenylate/guanylate cyclase domain-containing protein, partial [Chloroflexi bacterium]|nr:adenylate/guanylate cyclase domain-containing protein [Chloroflexota bacterium]